MPSLTVTLKTITPLFCGGANPTEKAEIRIPSIKGALRFWYRALDARYEEPVYKNGPTWESAIFGGTKANEGRGKFAIRLGGLSEGNSKWNRDRYRDLTEGDDTHSTNGVIYLAYPMDARREGRREQRVFIPPGRIFSVIHSFPRPPDVKTLKALVAAWWLLTHIGGLGARARKGFGTLGLIGWKAEGMECEQTKEFPITNGLNTPEQWENAFKAGIGVLRSWFPESLKKTDHTILPQGARFYLLKYGNGPMDGYAAWETALNSAGLILQRFRQRYGKGDVNGDYTRVKAHLGKRLLDAPCDVERRFLSGPAPDRVAFGLPLAFRYSSMEYKTTNRDGKPISVTPNITLVGGQHDRSASPLFIRIVQIGTVCHPFFALLDGPLLSSKELVKDQRDKEGRFGWRPPGRRILLEFCEQAIKPASSELII